jgi:ferric-dicitrate binding protein FerR (iron transport regulator)
VRRLSGQASPEELLELDVWAGEDPMNRQWLDRVTNEEQLEKEIQLWRNIDPAEGHAKWMAYMQVRRISRVRRIVGWSAAAAVLIAVVLVGLHRRGSGGEQPLPALVTSQPVVLPGRNTATLTLANGQTLLLDSAGTGKLATQGTAQLTKLDSGSLAYSTAGEDKEAPVTYNVLTTPKSGQFQVILPDGSHVWLNNVSSLRYPTAFRGPNRRVELTGEGYFEIAKVEGKPFIVSVNGEEVEVLGTSFNIKAYADEGNTQTTLLTGSVRVKAEHSIVELRPDEQAQWSGAGKLIIAKDVPSQDIISWKNGFFYFGRASFKEVMRQLARWYDVDVKYEGAAPDLEFGGKIDRSLPLNDLLHFLDKNQVHLRLEGRTLVVLPS